MITNLLSQNTLQQRKNPRAEDLRGPYLRDQTAIIHSLPFRRLKHKTQVFFSPDNDHICTRIEHVMHVATIAGTIARGLNCSGWKLSEELAFTIGIGHDLGHAPFGHTGESILNNILKAWNAVFIHEINGLRVVDHLANDGQGLNLTFGVRDGIVCHNGEKFEHSLQPAPTPNNLETIHDRNCLPSTLEGCIVRFSDKIAYLGRDIEDAIEAGLITEAEIPLKVRQALGSRNGEIIKALVLDIIESSKDGDAICFSPEKFELINELKCFNYSHIYLHPCLREYEQFCGKILPRLFEHLLELHAEFKDDFPKYQAGSLALNRAFGNFLQKMQSLYQSEKNPAPPWRMVTDYISGMTDSYALNCLQQISIPAPLRLRPR